MDLSLRRRNRVAGTVAGVGADGELQLLCEQTTGNCPKYITVSVGPALPASAEQNGGRVS
jgi:hypothetical protein